MEFHGFHGIPWNPWIPWSSMESMESMDSMELHGFHEFHGIHDIPWNSTEFHGTPHNPIDFERNSMRHGTPWNFMDLSNDMEFNRISCKFNEIPLTCMELHRISLNFKEFTDFQKSSRWGTYAPRIGEGAKHPPGSTKTSPGQSKPQSYVISIFKYQLNSVFNQFAKSKNSVISWSNLKLWRQIAIL